MNRLNLNYSYDSFGNVKQHYDNNGYFSFGYDGQNRLTGAYGKTYLYDSAGRLTDYEGFGYSSYEGHAIKKSGYTYDANGNLISRNGTTLAWNHENRLSGVSGGGQLSESYLYDDQGIRVKKYRNGVSTYYPFAHYEVEGATVIKYYFFNGMRVAMKRSSTFTYLHADHLGSTVLETNTSGTATATQKYCAYGNRRTVSGSTQLCGTGNGLVTDHTFTGQKYDGTGLMYYNARYYDPTLGAFISPDSIVPDATNLLDYNRYMYVRGRVLNMNDPTGHQAACTMDADGNMECADNAVTGGVTLSVDLANEPQSSNPNGTREFLTTMATIGVASFGGAFVTPYLASLWPTAVQGGTATATAACADGDCTSEIRTATQASNYINRVSQVRSLLDIGRGRNVAVANYNIQGATGEVIGVSGNAVRPGTVNVPTTRFFQTIVDKFPRDFDSEVKVLENIAQKFATSPGVHPNVQGRLTLFSERPLCDSCAGVVQQFQQMFPNIAVEVVTGAPK